MSEAQMLIVLGWVNNAEAFLSTCRPSKDDNAIMAMMVGECVARIEKGATMVAFGQSLGECVARIEKGATMEEMYPDGLEEFLTEEEECKGKDGTHGVTDEELKREFDKNNDVGF